MVMSEQRLRGRMPCDIWVRGNSKCKGPEVRNDLVSVRISKKVAVERRRGA